MLKRGRWQDRAAGGRPRRGPCASSPRTPRATRPSPSDRQARRHAPTAVLERASGRSIVISVTDAASGVARAALEVRRTQRSRTGHSPPRSGTVGCARSSIAAAPRASTCASPSATRRATSPRATPRASRPRARRSAGASGRCAPGASRCPSAASRRLRGRLTLSAGQPFAGQTIVATAAIRRRGARPRPAGTAVTDRRGRFSLRVPAGPSRTYRLVFNGAGGALGVARGVSVRVPASSTIRASRTRVSGRTRVRFSGRLRNRGQRIPGRGLVLVLQGRERRTLAHIRGHPHEPQRPLAGQLHVQRPARALSDPGPHPPPVELPVRAGVLASADRARRLRGAKLSGRAAYARDDLVRRALVRRPVRAGRGARCAVAPGPTRSTRAAGRQPTASTDGWRPIRARAPQRAATMSCVALPRERSIVDLHGDTAAGQVRGLVLHRARRHDHPQLQAVAQRPRCRARL